jgi:hypothetical protein
VGREESQESSFSEEKEAKRLSPIAPGPAVRKWGKVFWFFFSKKNRLLA